MLKGLKFFSGLIVVSGLMLAACSSRKSEAPVSVSEEAGEAILNSGIEESGLIAFFAAQPERGLVIKSIDWTKSVSSENPGADCELKRKTTMPAFVCIVREQQEAVVLTIHEDGAGEGRRLKKITLDGKGEETRNRWETALTNSGYVKSDGPAPAKAGRSWMTSADNKSDVQIVWAPAAEAVTLIFAPHSAAKAAPKAATKAKPKAKASKGPAKKRK